VTRSSLAGIPRSTFVEPERVWYRSFDGRMIPALLYLPEAGGPQGAAGGVAPRAVMMSIHGGPESQERPMFSSVYQYLLHRGYGILAPNIRGSTGYGKAYVYMDNARKRGDAIQDVVYAVRYLSSRADVDAKRIGIMGGSYGGYMTLAAVAFHPKLWAAAIDIVGIANFESFLANTGPWRRKLRIAEYGDPEKDLEYLRKFSPIHKVDDIVAPLMVIHGKQDPRVPASEAEQIVASMKARGRPVEFLLFEDEGHGLAKLPNRIKAYTAMGDFLDKYLSGQNQK
jgi:dipeptidyl aminopeptidase/acylaminoacyl peptidase